jgi:hypothetical protein
VSANDPKRTFGPGDTNSWASSAEFQSGRPSPRPFRAPAQLVEADLARYHAPGDMPKDAEWATKRKLHVVPLAVRLTPLGVEHRIESVNSEHRYAPTLRESK